VSYQTIENKGVIPRELRAGIGAHVYGCDVCAEVCPWNRFAQESRSVLLTARHELAALSLRELLALTPGRFAEVFRKTAIKRVKLAGLLRNACVVAGNTRAAECLDQLVTLAAHESALVRAHAVWAVYRIAGHARAVELLGAARAAETDATVLAEYTAE
jgi:epoxyqueuosine reductase